MCSFISDQGQQLHFSDAPLHTQPWAHLEQPTGQQEQQLFLQEPHLQSLHLQELWQLQAPPAQQEQLGSMWQWSDPRQTEEEMHLLSSWGCSESALFYWQGQVRAQSPAPLPAHLLP